MSHPTFSNFLTLVLENNPVAISQNLVNMGYLDSLTDDAAELKEVLLVLVQQAKDGGEKLLLDALNVPLNAEGESADELFALYTAKANKGLLTTFLRKPVRQTSKPKTNLKEGILYFEWDADRWIRCVGFVVLILVGVFILQKLISRD